MDEASRRITDKLWRRILPANEPAKTWGGRGSGLNCDGCVVPILPSESELEALLVPVIAAFMDGLREYGYVDGRNLKVEYRWANGRDERYPELVPGC